MVAAPAWLGQAAIAPDWANVRDHGASRIREQISSECHLPVASKL
jgi:hypothetical protein